MKVLKFISFLLLLGCIQTDLEDPFPPTLRIENSIAEIEFRVSGSYILEAVYTDDTGEPADVTFDWESSDESIISFEGNVATVHREGLTILTASANGLSDSRVIETLESRGSLIISGFAPLIQTGGTTSFKFNYIDPDGRTNNMVMPQWASTNESVATIDQDGIITTHAAGMTDITITLDGIGNVVSLEVTDEPVMTNPVLQITSFASFLNAGERFQFQADYYNGNGELVNEQINWSSSDETVLSIDGDGLATALLSGTAIIEATFGNVTTTIEVLVEEVLVDRTGSLMGIGYNISGDFTLSVNEDRDLILTVTNYVPDGPGPYFYLTNQNNSVANGLNLGAANSSGTVTINVTELDETVGLRTYNFLMVWCEPFNVRLGVGEFQN